MGVMGVCLGVVGTHPSALPSLIRARWMHACMMDASRGRLGAADEHIKVSTYMVSILLAYG